MATFRKMRGGGFDRALKKGSRVSLSLPGILLLSMLSNLCFAEDSLSLTPGLWEIETSTDLPELSQSISRKTTRCIATSDFDPSIILHNDKQCTISDKKLADDSMTWSLECDVPGRGMLQGTGEFHSQGEHAEGGTNLQVYDRGEEVEIITTWKGHRIGDCN